MTNRPEWPVEIDGVIESLITTPEQEGRWNVAALGLHADDNRVPTGTVRARTWGKTRTRRNFERTGVGYVQFLRDPKLFVEAALGVYEIDEPILETAAAWAEVEVHRIGTGTVGGTEWVDWALRPEKVEIRRRTVPTIDRALGAVVEMTVAASRLGVPAYDDGVLHERLDFYATVVDSCGGPAARSAVRRIGSLTDWQPDYERGAADEAHSGALE